MIELPERMEDVTLAWLQHAIGDHPHFKGRHIAAARGKSLGEGIGQTSALARFELGYDGAAGPQSVVVKLHTPFRAMRDVGLRYELYLRETAFYRSLAADVAAPIPTIYFAAWDQPAERNAIVMQDLTAWHWADQLTGATQQQAERCIDALAKLGARHWGADFSHYPWLPDTHRPVLQQVAADYRAVVPITLERLGSFLSADQRAGVERIARNMDWINAAIAKPPQILTHYDSRLENFAFRDAGGSELVMIDWQLVARLRPGWDVAYFFGSSLTEADRRRWQAALIERYLEGLRAGGVRDYDAAAFDADFRLATMAITIISVIGGASFDMRNERSKSLFGVALRRGMASVVENESQRLLPA